MTDIAAPAPRSQALPLWALGLAWLVVLVFAEGWLFWMQLPYDQKPDQDWVLVYNALVMNAGLPQEYFDHTGYAYLLLLTGWFRLLHVAGALPVDTVTALPPTTDTAAFELAWQQATEAGRVLTLVIISGFVVAFAALVAKFVDDRRIGFLAGLALATGGGVASQVGLLRTEPLSSLCAITAILLIAIAASGGWPARRFVLLAIAAFLAVLSVLTKVSGFLPLLAAPLVAVVCGPPLPAAKPPGRQATFVAAGIAVLVAIPAGAIAFEGLSRVAESRFPYHPLGWGPLAWYQALVPVWIFGGVLVCARLWGGRAMDTVAACAAIVIGASLGLAVLMIRPELQNIIAATHPLEHLFVFSVWTDPSLGQQETVLAGGLLGKLSGAFGQVIGAHFAAPTSDSLFLLDWLVVLALPLAVRDRDRRWALLAGLLLLVSIALQATFLLRYGNKTYHVYSDPFTILAAAVVLARFRWILATYAGTLLAIVCAGYIGVAGLLETVRLANLPPDNPSEICVAHEFYLKRIDNPPFCASG